MTSARDPQKATTGPAFAPIARHAAPNTNENTTTCSTSFRAMASMRLAGKMCSRTVLSVCTGIAGADVLRGQSAADARAQNVHRRKADKERDRGNELEVDDRLQADATHLLQITRPCDAVDECRENQWREDRTDQAQEDHADGCQVAGRCRKPHANRDARQHSCKDPLHALRPTSASAAAHRRTTYAEAAPDG